MIDLDDGAAVRAADPGGMLAAVAALPEDCRAGYRSGRAVPDLPLGEGVSAVAFCGMGGSGVTGDVVRALYRDRVRFPIDVVRGPVLPEFCGPHAFVLCSSYSGDTAEALACFEEAVGRGCRVVAITSGGELGRRAAELEVATVRVPRTFPAPRAALGFLTLGALGALETAGLAPPLSAELEEAAGTLDALVERLGPGRPRSENPAKELAHAIGDRIPVVWGAEGIGAVAASRWKTQMNENAKIPAFWSALPELDHNEVVGWSPGAGGRFVVVALRHAGEHPDMAARFPPSVRIAEESGAATAEVRADGRSALGRLLWLIAMGDFTSVYLGLLRGVDPTPMEAIDRLKRALTEA